MILDRPGSFALSRRIAAGLLALVGLGGLTGCPTQAPSSPEHYALQAESDSALSEYVRTSKDAKSRVQADTARTQLESFLAQLYGSPESPILPGFKPTQLKPDAAPRTPLENGRILYKQHCMHCHGYYGAGDGPTANFLLPRPRNFLYGEFKFTSTKAGAKPTHADLMRTIAQGVQGTMMPAFGPTEPTPDLTAIGVFAGFAGPPGFDVDGVAWYVQLLAMRGELERKLMAVFKDNGEITADDVQGFQSSIEAAWKDADNQALTAEAPRPDRSPEAIAKSVKAGDELFHTQAAQCVSCHGANGLGDGLDPNAPEAAKDIWGTALRPANLTLGVYRGGRRPIDLYRRVHVGIKGNVMPGFGAQLKPEQIWNLVDYVQSLGLRDEGKP